MSQQAVGSESLRVGLRGARGAVCLARRASGSRAGPRGRTALRTVAKDYPKPDLVTENYRRGRYLRMAHSCCLSAPEAGRRRRHRVPAARPYWLSVFFSAKSASAELG